jgi:hypothetical protein
MAGGKSRQTIDLIQTMVEADFILIPSVPRLLGLANDTQYESNRDCYEEPYTAKMFWHYGVAFRLLFGKFHPAPMDQDAERPLMSPGTEYNFGKGRITDEGEWRFGGGNVPYNNLAVLA